MAISDVYGLHITDAKITTLIKNEVQRCGNQCAVASVTFNNAIELRGIRVMQDENGSRHIVYPLDPYYKGETPSRIYTPVANMLNVLIQDAVLKAYDEEIASL